VNLEFLAMTWQGAMPLSQFLAFFTLLERRYARLCPASMQKVDTEKQCPHRHISLADFHIDGCFAAWHVPRPDYLSPSDLPRAVPLGGRTTIEHLLKRLSPRERTRIAVFVRAVR
jgi:hypothetical protein